MQLLTFLVLVTPLFVAASPVDLGTHCGKWDSVTIGGYALLLDQWNASAATNPSWQCAQITSIHGNVVSWKTSYDWAGESGVKSFTNIQLNTGINKRVNAIKSMPTVWHWSISTTTGTIADVGFDLFTSNTPGGPPAHEIMIWLANIHAGPLSYLYNSFGVAEPAATGIRLGGYTWNLYTGTNGYNVVHSFLLTSGMITKFNADILPFLTYLAQHEGVISSQYLITAQAGIEATSGSATMTTGWYSLSIN